MQRNERKYAVVDLETTGGNHKYDRITEIGIVISDGEKVINTFKSLVNPNRSIPYNITRITGITNEMVANAPQFYEIAKEVVEITEDCVFVAHNVKFDYGFLKAAFGELGYTFTRKTLDTVTLSRRAFPHLRSYSLGNLIKHFDLSVNARHRAFEDAMATAEVLQIILQQDQGIYSTEELLNRGIKESRLPESITIERLEGLPEEPGVYYFYNSFRQVIYVGKSINIQKRVLQHFGKNTKKSIQLTDKVFDLSYECTGNELAALLLESFEIKAIQPQINKAQRTKEYRYFVHTYYDMEGYICFEYLKANKKNLQNKTILNYYGSRPSALTDLAAAVEKFELCQHKMGISTKAPCFHLSIKKCHGACLSMEDAMSYNERATQALQQMKKIFDDNFVLILEGRDHDEKCVVLVEDGNYCGMGYISNEDLNYGIEEIKETVKYVPPNPEANGIIKTYLAQHPKTKKIEF